MGEVREWMRPADLELNSNRFLSSKQAGFAYYSH